MWTIRITCRSGVAPAWAPNATYGGYIGADGVYHAPESQWGCPRLGAQFELIGEFDREKFKLSQWGCPRLGAQFISGRCEDIENLNVKVAVGLPPLGRPIMFKNPKVRVRTFKESQWGCPRLGAQ